MSIVKKPAKKKRTPAKRIIEAVSSLDISKSLYPILIIGKAEPHSKQQIIAMKQTENKVFGFFKLDFICLLRFLS